MIPSQEEATRYCRLLLLSNVPFTAYCLVSSAMLRDGSVSQSECKHCLKHLLFFVASNLRRASVGKLAKQAHPSVQEVLRPFKVRMN